MNDLDSLLTEWARPRRAVAAPDDFATGVLAVVRETPIRSDFLLPNPLAMPICLAVGLFKFAFVLQLAF